MEGSSDHTRLMNIFLGLSMNIPKWPNTLKQLGYEVEIIEGDIPEANPDLIFTSRRLDHSLIIECKSKNTEEKQINKYLQLKFDPSLLIKRGLVNKVIHQHRYMLDIAFTSFFDISHDKLLIKNSIPFLYVIKENSSKIKIIEKRISDFTKNELNQKFPIQIPEDSRPPYLLYPFDPKEKEIFVISILTELLNFSLKGKSTFTMEELLKSIFKSIWEVIGDHKKKEFRNIGTRLLEKIKKEELKPYIKKEDNVWHVILKKDNKSYQAFQNKCNVIIKSLKEKLKQKTLKEI